MNDNQSIRGDCDDVLRVYLYGRQIGRVRPVRCGCFEALCNSGQSMGWFNSAHGAAQAMLEATVRANAS